MAREKDLFGGHSEMSIIGTPKKDKLYSLPSFSLAIPNNEPKVTEKRLCFVLMEDRIGELSDDILSFILSFLTMRDAVKTRILLCNLYSFIYRCCPYLQPVLNSSLLNNWICSYGHV
uniref:F-box domain-containing protein n=1 Tax=Populus trichocarpa TaxID=3694 RepID=A0A3N7HY50_POPTR